MTRPAAKSIALALTAIAAAVLLVLLGRYSMRLYHSAAQLFCASVGFIVFNLGWHGRSFTRNNLLIVVPAACLTVGVLDILHFYVYNEPVAAGVFGVPGPDSAALLGSASRLTLSIALLIASIRLPAESVMSATKAIVTCTVAFVIVVATLLLGLLPPAYVPGTGTTDLKLLLEIAPIPLFIASAVMFLRHRDSIDSTVLGNLLMAIAFLTLTCVIFASYDSLLSARVIAGETIKTMGYGFLYVALVRNSLRLPYESLFRKLTESERALRRELESRIDAEGALRISEQRFRELFETSCDGIVMVDLNEIVLDCNEAFVRLLGYRRASEVRGRSVYSFVPQRARDEIGRTVGEQVLASGFSEEFEVELVSAAGQTVPVSVRAWLRRDQDGKPIGVWAIARDITERKQSEARIQYLSFHDSLTGLYNRAYFEEEMRRIDTRRQLPLSLIMGDVNGLKIVNDVFGHQEGDKLLQSIARVLEASCRHEDVVARWGGDEFAILLPRTPAATARLMCERIQEACRKSPPQPIDLSISLGSATRESLDEPLSSLLQAAEDRMYSSKLKESRAIRESILRSLESLLWETHHETREHVQRMDVLATQFARHLRLPERMADELSLLAKMHDIGKISVPRDVLNKPGRLTADEWTVIMKHPETGYRIAEASPELQHIAQAILSHHEHWDGTGYPQGLEGRDIPMLARIIAIIDAFDIMVGGRPYQAPMTPAEAVQELRRRAGSQFDPRLVDSFIQTLEAVESFGSLYKNEAAPASS